MKIFIRFIALALLIILSGLLIISCGTRNVKKTEVKEEEKKEIEHTEKSEEKKEEKRKTVKETDSDVEEEKEFLVPIDPKKPIKKTIEEKDGKKIITWENASVDTSKKKDKSKDKETTDEQVNTDTKKASVKKETQSKKTSDTSKEIQKKTGFPYGILWILLLIPIYLAYRKIRKRFNFI